MGEVYPAVAECDRPRHEVFVLTDLARSSWMPDQRAEGLDKVEKAKNSKTGKIATFILRLGSDDISDVAVLSAEPAATVATQGEPLEIRGLVQNLGKKAASRVVEFYLDGVKKRRQGRRTSRRRSDGGELHDSPTALRARRSTRESSGSAARPTRSSSMTAGFSPSRSAPLSRSCSSPT